MGTKPVLLMFLLCAAVPVDAAAQPERRFNRNLTVKILSDGLSVASATAAALLTNDTGDDDPTILIGGFVGVSAFFSATSGGLNQDGPSIALSVASRLALPTLGAFLGSLGNRGCSREEPRCILGISDVALGYLTGIATALILDYAILGWETVESSPARTGLSAGLAFPQGATMLNVGTRW